MDNGRKEGPRGKGGAEGLAAFTGWARGSLWGARGLVCRAWRDPRVQQTSAEALPFFPVLLGLAAGIIIFSQVPRESFNHVTRALIPLCVQTPSPQRHLPSGFERGTWGQSHYTAHLPHPPSVIIMVLSHRVLKTRWKMGMISCAQSLRT